MGVRFLQNLHFCRSFRCADSSTSFPSVLKTFQISLGTTVAISRCMREWIDELERRTGQFAVDVIHLANRLRRVPGLQSACSQMIDSSGSVASNHLAMRRGRSDRTG